MSQAVGFTPGTASNPTTEVELSISCKNLLDSDVLSKSDPMCVIFLREGAGKDWREIFRTKTIGKTLNPTFAKKAVLTYRFEIKQELKFSVYDVDSDSTDLKSHDFLGSCSATLGQLVSAGTSILPLEGGRPENIGQLNVSIEELVGPRDEVVLQFQGSDLNNHNWWIFAFGQPYSVFLEVAKATEDGTYKLVHRTEVIHGSNNPLWKKFSIRCDDYDQDLSVTCCAWSFKGTCKELGKFHTTLKQLSNMYFECHQYDANKRKLGQRSYGCIFVEHYEARKIYTFLDYINNGTTLNCSFGIDFTSSNGDPRDKDSLHYFNKQHINHYEQALRAVGNIIQDYDSDNMFPVLGFGAQIPPDGRVSHEFFVNMDSSPYVKGIDGVIESYKKCLSLVQLSGPTYFSPIIRHISQFAQAYQDGSQYFILLIITDGVMTDIEQTKKAIVDASKLPLSIIIVGVGEADFSLMEELDSDTAPLVSNGNQAARDIIQFVPFKKFQFLEDPIVKAVTLGSEVLAEIPDQIVGYMKLKGIEPAPSFQSKIQPKK